MKNGFFVVMGIAVIAIIGLFSLYDDSSISKVDREISFLEQKITPEISIATEKKYSIEPTTLQALPENQESISKSLNVNSFSPLRSAFAVNSTQNTITITQWETNSGHIRAFDSQGNFFTWDTPNKIGRANITSEVHTQWILPNHDTFGTGSMDVDSSGNVFFSQSENIASHKITKLDHNTNTFTEWILPNSEQATIIKIDSNDDVYFFSSTSNILGRLNPSNNTITTWGGIATTPVNEIKIDSNDDVYVVSGPTLEIIQFEPSSNTITTWSTLAQNHPPTSADIDLDGNIFFIGEVPVNTLAIARIDPNAQLIKEWLIPELSDCGTCTITVDSSGNVFFGNEEFNRLVPATNTVTSWDQPRIEGVFEVNSTDVIIWAFRGEGGTIT